MEKSLLARIRTLKLSYYGHIMRKANCLEKDIIQGCVPGSRGRGRPSRRWRKDISDSEWTGLRINDAARSAEDRDKCEGSYVPPTLQQEDGHRRRRCGAVLLGDFSS